ncbi:MAG: hypothetical protein J0H01_24250 [Rhizobiales bacterium]|nr:hypothetical protein [Hyphomicrobiales bacterium]
MKTFTLAVLLLAAISAPALAQGGADAAQVEAYDLGVQSSAPRIGVAREFSARAIAAPIARPAGRELPQIDRQAVPEVASPN